MSMVAMAAVMTRKIGTSPTALRELLAMREAVADLAANEAVYLPIFERLDAMVSAHEAADPISRARALLATQKAMA